MNAIAKLEQGLQAKSLDALVAAASQEDAFLVMDCSSSMGAKMSNGKTRIAGLGEVVADIVRECNPQMVAFAGNYWEGGDCFMVGEAPADCGGSTPLAAAINFAKENGATRLVVISDGVPDSREAAINAAMLFGGRIDVVFVGDAGDAGSAFLNKLAKLTGGTRFNGDLGETKKLSAAIAGLLSA